MAREGSVGRSGLRDFISVCPCEPILGGKCVWRNLLLNVLSDWAA